MKGFVPTPAAVVDEMVARLFAGKSASANSVLLDPGCGEGEFIEGVLRWCRGREWSPPRIVGIELHPGRAQRARRRFAKERSVVIAEADFLEADIPKADYVIGNPPYVAITQLSETEKVRYRERFTTASGRFDLYVLFFEQALRHLKPHGRLVFVTPEKYLSVGSAKPLRKLLARQDVREVFLLPEDAFPGVVTYPAVTIVDAAPVANSTRVTLRDGSVQEIAFPADGSSVNALIYSGSEKAPTGPVLADITRRISCGVATGADRVFVQPKQVVPAELRPFALPTLAGRELNLGTAPSPSSIMLVPYDHQGALLPPDRLGALGSYLSNPARKKTLMRRTCVRRKPWYAFHETPPMDDVLRPKLLCKDIARDPHFWIDREGNILPRHSVYYIVPHDPGHLDVLANFLNDKTTTDWLMANAQPAANGYRRLQSTILKQIPVPETAVTAMEAATGGNGLLAKPSFMAV